MAMSPDTAQYPPCIGIGAFTKVERRDNPLEAKFQEIRETFEKRTPDNSSNARFIDNSSNFTTRQDFDCRSSEHLPGLEPGEDAKVDWTLLGKYTGTRPSINKYSVERYSLDKWRNHNDKILDRTLLDHSNLIEFDAKSIILQAFSNVDYKQQYNNKQLKQKARETFRWKTLVEISIRAITEEIHKLEFERQRLKAATRNLMMPESISKECLDLRINRATPDLVADFAETALLKEMEMVKEVKSTFQKTSQKIDEQLTIDKAAKQKMEFDWSDKTMAHDCDTGNIGLNNKSKTIMFIAGATKFGENSAPTAEYWEYYCRKNIEEVETARQMSIDLRSTVDGILREEGKKLRMLADKTDIALAKTIAITQEILKKLENQLIETLQKIADVEKLLIDHQNSIRKMDNAMKLAQTRLDNRNKWRLHGENVTDKAQVGLIDEVRKIHETVTILNSQLTNSRRIWGELKEKRIILETAVAAKRKTLNIDRGRIGIIRSHYPSALELSGY